MYRVLRVREREREKERERERGREYLVVKLRTVAHEERIQAGLRVPPHLSTN